MPFVPSSQRLNTTTNTIQVTEPINPPPLPPPQQQTNNEDTETHNSQNNYENPNNNNNNNNDLEDLLLTVLDELDIVKGLLLEQGIVQQQKTKTLPTTETLTNKLSLQPQQPKQPHQQQQLLPIPRNAPDFSNCF